MTDLFLAPSGISTLADSKQPPYFFGSRSWLGRAIKIQDMRNLDRIKLDSTI